MSFPKGFLFCTSTASYQIEGAWNEDGKGENIWDRLTHSEPDIVENKDNGDIACDSYRLYKEDVKLIKHIGMYRFSISWARILPNGEITNINEAGITYYNNLIDELLKNGIEPLVSMYHWDLPQRLQDIGGWLNPLIIDCMEDYADLLFKLYGDRVKWWITINEPLEILKGYESRAYAPALNLDSPANYIVAHNILRAHGRIFRLYDKKYRATQNGKLSISLNSKFFEPKSSSKEDVESAERAMQFYIGMFTHPIFTKEGDYPPIMRKIVDENSKKEGRNRSRLPSFTNEEKEALIGASDFFAFNYYSAGLCTPGASPDAIKFIQDIDINVEVDPSWPTCKAAWLRVSPFGIRKVLKWIKDNCGNPPIFITENGYCDEGEIDDIKRVLFYRDHLQEVLNAMNDHGCNVIGFTAWSLLDNFEWLHGYSHRFGIVHVDFQDKNRKRTPKKSAQFFKQLVSSFRLPEV